MEKVKCDICQWDHASQDNASLSKKYLEMNKAGFDITFGRNARKCGDNIAEILLGRGITEVPNIFGPIQIRKWPIS